MTETGIDRCEVRGQAGHLRKVFTKFGITSRSQLDRVLPTGSRS